MIKPRRKELRHICAHVGLLSRMFSTMTNATVLLEINEIYFFTINTIKNLKIVAPEVCCNLMILLLRSLLWPPCWKFPLHVTGSFGFSQNKLQFLTSKTQSTKLTNLNSIMNHWSKTQMWSLYLKQRRQYYILAVIFSVQISETARSATSKAQKAFTCV